MKEPRRLVRRGSTFSGKPAKNLLVLLALFQRGAEDVAKRCARIGRAVLGDRLLLFGDLERFDRHLDLADLLVELDDAGVDLLADREAFGALLRAVAREFRALDEGGEVGADDLDVDAAFLDVDDLAGDHRALLDVARLCEWIAFE